MRKQATHKVLGQGQPRLRVMDRRWRHPLRVKVAWQSRARNLAMEVVEFINLGRFISPWLIRSPCILRLMTLLVYLFIEGSTFIAQPAPKEMRYSVRQLECIEAKEVGVAVGAIDSLYRLLSRPPMRRVQITQVEVTRPTDSIQALIIMTH